MTERSDFPQQYNNQFDLIVRPRSHWRWAYWLLLLLVFNPSLLVLAIILLIEHRYCYYSLSHSYSISEVNLNSGIGGIIGPVALVLLEKQESHAGKLMWVFKDQVRLRQWRQLSRMLNMPLQYKTER
ncbi:hypothetical protein N9W11_00305 [Psychrosphaera haliotis]|nr:hypothetical protein [Psychrosphaera haliotis]